MEPEQNRLAESIERLIERIEALTVAVNAATESLAGALRHGALPPQMTAQGVEE